MTRARTHGLRSGRWVVDIGTATATFAVRNLGRTVLGSVPVRSGSIVVGPGGELESVTGTVELAALATDKARRDRDLRKPRLLDLDAHPLATFTSDTVWATADGCSVRGTFIARGRSIPLDFAVSVDGDAWVGTACFDRKALGVKAPSVFIGRTVTVTVRARLG
jgi:polyisoprenoid-binding protein YceI